MAADVEVRNEGSIVLVYALSETGETWIKENVSTEGYQPDFPKRIIVEARYARDVLSGMLDAGLIPRFTTPRR